MSQRFSYLSRIIDAYVLRKTSQLDFWHGIPEVNPNARYDAPGPYYQKFRYKALYRGPRDENGIPLLDYHGKIGKQYNPIAIAQYGLGHYNLCEEGLAESCREFIKVSDFMLDRLEKNEKGLYVWFHYFDWDYFGKVKSPWYSGLAQGNGISLLIRAYHKTGDKKYLVATERATKSLFAPIQSGGCTYTDTHGYKWIEEIIKSPPTHILNGFIWAVFGVYDMYIFAKNPFYRNEFDSYIRTLQDNLPIFDAKIWSFYDATSDKMLASPFYHRLHIVQLKILHRMTGKPVFKNFADKWYAYTQNDLNKLLAFFYKAGFKLLRY